MKRGSDGRYQKQFNDDCGILDVTMTRQQNASCKLTDEDIALVRHLRGSGFLQKELAEIFEVAPSTIRYWTNDVYRKKANKRNSERSREKQQSPEYNQARYQRYKKRVKEMGMPVNEKARLRASIRRKKYREENPSKVNMLYTFDGKSMSMKDWAKHLDIPYMTVYSRIHTYKLPPERCFVK